MSGFNPEIERERIGELGASRIVSSLVDQLWAVTSERTGFPYSGELRVEDKSLVTADGFDHRKDGDLIHTYEKSVEEAKEEIRANRYKLENKGYELAKKLFFEVPDYSTVVLFSPAPEYITAQMGEDGYKEGQSMVYFYYVLPGETDDQKTIKFLSWKHYFSKKEQSLILNALLGREVVEDDEGSILNHPFAEYGFGSDTNSFSNIWKEIEKVYREKKRNFVLPPYLFMEQLLLYGREYKDRHYKDLSIIIEDLAERFANGETDEELSKDWAIMLNLADQQLLYKDITDVCIEKEYYYPEQIPTLQNSVYPFGAGAVYTKYQDLDYEPRVAVGPCGPTGGLGADRSLISSQTITTGTYEIERVQTDIPQSQGERKLKCKECPLCGAKDIVATIKNQRIICPKCNKSVPYEC